MLFSFQMCAKILESSSKINMDEYNFFLRGGVVSVTTNTPALVCLTGRDV